MKLNGRTGGAVMTAARARESLDEIGRQSVVPLVATVGNAAVLTDNQGHVLLWNDAAERLLGWTADETLGRLLFDLVPCNPVEEKAEPVTRTLATGGRWSGLLELPRKDGSAFTALVTGSPVLDGDGRLLAVVCVAADVGEWLSTSQELERMARFDPLTCLPNRAGVLHRLGEALAESSGESTAVICCDVDGFGAINDSFGPAVGDALLCEVAERLVRATSPGSWVARLGGDDFAVVCPRTDTTQAIRQGERLQRAFAEPITLEPGETFVSVTVGMTVSQSPSQPERLLSEAAAALGVARGRGSGQRQVFDTELRQDARHRLSISSELRSAVEEDQLELVYQPERELASGRVAFFEALLRWHHPTRGLLMPSEFIPVAEQTGLVLPLGRWAIEAVCRQLATWQAPGHPLAGLPVAVNVSAVQLADPLLSTTIDAALRVEGIDPSLLWVELTESALVTDPEHANAVLHELKELGVSLAIDDFGIGYSSLAYLHRFPIDALKIDRSFVSGTDADGAGRRISEAVIALAHSLGLVTIAEGVETPAQARRLRALGCDYAQGFLWSKPAPAHALATAVGPQPRSA